MKLRKLSIKNFKNLRDFEIDFGKVPFTTVVLGQNGTGKSNLLEALIIIFGELDLGEPPTFAYELSYECREREISITADPALPRRDQVKITVGDANGLVLENISYRRFAQDPTRTYLPSYVFGYYSGPSNRMEKHFDKHQERFYRDLLSGEERPLRPLLYARPEHSQFALLSFFTEDEANVPEGELSMREFLDRLLGIEELISVMFVLREPPWRSREGDPRFWHARGVVRQLLARIYERSTLPIRESVRITAEFANKKTLEHLYLYLRNRDQLQGLANQYDSPQEFFKALESTYISKILSEVRIQLRRRNADGSLTFRDLSEGEQQLLMVLGLLRFTKEHEALFLLDEPDTHLNPAWGVQYLDLMRQVVGEQPTSHVILTTHNPLVIASLKREDVRIMQRERGRADRERESVRAVLPDEDPQGMGVAAILTSDLFGLRSTLDQPTQDDLDKRRRLAFSDKELSQEEESELNRLNQQLANLDFSITVRDPLYQSFASEYREFVREFTRRAAPDLKEGIVFTPEQRQRQRELTRQILRELKAQRGQRI
ncbi:MAG TPA: AAA family ATPase [Ktedonobacteraceae bacterium]